MKKSIALLIMFFVSTTFIQAQIIPQPSPGASASQTVGITEIKLDYSRPGVKGRKVFGELIRYGKIWRTGANTATRISFSNNVKINEMPLKAGKYSIVTIPGEDTWEIIFSNDLEVTETTYNPKNDALRVKVKPYKTNFTETFTIDFSDIHEAMARLNIYWEHTGVSVQIQVDNESAILSAIDSKSNETAGAFMQAAEYLYTHNMNLNQALDYIDKSISLQETFRNTWIKSMILNKGGNSRDALRLAVKAQNLGKNDPVYTFFKDTIDAAVLELKKEVE
jgi:hypothetical protein